LNSKILVTGSEGLIGRALAQSLFTDGCDVKKFDIKATKSEEYGDIRDLTTVRKAIDGVNGIIHLAAVSRVILGEQNPKLCWETNVGGMCNIITSLTELTVTPWILFASSREIYGESDNLPVKEDTIYNPINVYAKTKTACEKIILKARRNGLRTAVVRLSNVYGDVNDYNDRVIPAFARQAVLGKTLRVEGDLNTFDFTHLEDTVRGIQKIIRILESGEDNPPPIHLLTGIPTSLGELAKIIIELAGSKSEIIIGPSRSYDVSNFYGCPQRAKEILGWVAKISIREGLVRFIKNIQNQLDS